MATINQNMFKIVARVRGSVSSDYFSSLWSNQPYLLLRAQIKACNKIFSSQPHRLYSSKCDTDEVNTPYKNPGPRNYGYQTKYMTEGLLPRSEEEKKFIPEYKPKDSWNRKRALFGQNDYIDILGDGNVHPVNLIKGPPWLIGYNGNEFQRLSRRLKFEMPEVQDSRPQKYHNIKKRLFYLYKWYNQRRVSRWK